MGKQAYKSHRMKFFENLKMQNVSCVCVCVCVCVRVCLCVT